MIVRIAEIQVDPANLDEYLERARTIAQILWPMNLALSRFFRCRISETRAKSEF